jgi:hypothetical protein
MPMLVALLEISKKRLPARELEQYLVRPVERRTPELLVYQLDNRSANT